MADPSYIRLADHMSDSMVADIAGGSGWSISGRDVQAFPKEDDAASRFVRSRLVLGLLEPCGKAEYEEVQEANRRMAEVAPRVNDKQEPVNLQEADIQRVAASLAKKLGQSQEDEGDDEDDEVSRLRGRALDDALRLANLDTSGNAEEKRERLREFRNTPH